MGTRRLKVLTALAGLVVLAAACGKSTPTAGSSSSPSSKGTIVVGTVSFSESQIVAQMFAQVLTKAGYTVPALKVVGTRAILQPAMPGQIQVAPEYVGSLSDFLEKNTESNDPVSETAHDNALLAAKGLTVLDPSAANDTNAFVVTSATAKKYNLAKMSDLQPVAAKLKLGAPPDCPTNQLCLLGLKSLYGLGALQFQAVSACDNQIATALDTGAVDVAELCSTQSVIAQKGWVVLQDDKGLQPADDIAAEVSSALLTAHPDVKSLLAAVTSKLTTANLTALDAKVDIDKQDASTVAKDFLTSNGLL